MDAILKNKLENWIQELDEIVANNEIKYPLHIVDDVKSVLRISSPLPEPISNIANNRKKEMFNLLYQILDDYKIESLCKPQYESGYVENKTIFPAIKSKAKTTVENINEVLDFIRSLP